MNHNMNPIIKEYLNYCQTQKRLDKKTLKAYCIDLTQFASYFENLNCKDSTEDIELYIGHLNKSFKPKTAKRKLASIKALYRYLEYKDIIETNPFNKLRLTFREPVLLPKTIPLHTLEALLVTIYNEYTLAKTKYKKKRTLLDIAVIETLFATGIRISELCNLKCSDIDLIDAAIRIYGKGDKERIIQIGNENVLNLLKKYREEYSLEISESYYFFTTPKATPLSDQSVRRMINKYCHLSSIDLHITPHMFRHTFATSLLEADVDIRYIQEMLGHSSITVTEIYTHVALSKQKDILSTKHPRNGFNFCYKN